MSLTSVLSNDFGQHSSELSKKIREFRTDSRKT